MPAKDPFTTPVRSSRPRLSGLALNMLVATYLMAACNLTFWRLNAEVFDGAKLTIAGLGLAVWALTMLLVTLLAFRWWQKPMLAGLLILAAATSYYMDTLGVVIDREMIQNAMTTTLQESKHLITFGFVSHVVIWGVLPALFVFWVQVKPQTFLRNVGLWALTCVLMFALFFGAVFTDFKTYSAALRERKELQWSIQPAAPIAAGVRYAKLMMRSTNIVVEPYGTDAVKGPRIVAATKPVLTVIVAGETARAMNFGLNGYARDTTPELAKRDIVNFSDTQSCGTATATSLPCMFSSYGREDFSYEGGLNRENLLDILARTGMKVLWWDNNTGDKGQAARQTLESFTALKDPVYCAKGECIDGIFLDRLDKLADTITEDTVVVIHQIGSHGPAYHLRYDDAHERFKPTCNTAEFDKCTPETIANSYDNTIAYTDWFLAQVIDRLAAKERVIPVMFYASDHGESLGEGGLYLHGAPYFMAPEEQTSVPMLMWVSPAFRGLMGLDAACLAAEGKTATSHDNIFHTILGLLDIQTTVRQDDLDLTAKCKG